MRDLKSSGSLFLNGVLQFGIGSVGAFNDLFVKVPGFVLNEFGTRLGAGLHRLSDVTESKLVARRPIPGYSVYLAECRKVDLYARYLIDNPPSLSDVREAVSFPDWLKRKSADVVDESTGEIIVEFKENGHGEA